MSGFLIHACGWTSRHHADRSESAAHHEQALVAGPFDGRLEIIGTHHHTPESVGK